MCEASLSIVFDWWNFIEGMIVAENTHASTEQNLEPGTLQMTRLANGEAEISNHKSNNGKDALTDDVNGNALPNVSSVSFLVQKSVRGMLIFDIQEL